MIGDYSPFGLSTIGGLALIYPVVRWAPTWLPGYFDTVPRELDEGPR